MRRGSVHVKSFAALSTRGAYGSGNDQDVCLGGSNEPRVERSVREMASLAPAHDDRSGVRRRRGREDLFITEARMGYRFQLAES
jgi:hypothetical protein